MCLGDWVDTEEVVLLRYCVFAVELVLVLLLLALLKGGETVFFLLLGVGSVLVRLVVSCVDPFPFEQEEEDDEEGFEVRVWRGAWQLWCSSWAYWAGGLTRQRLSRWCLVPLCLALFDSATSCCDWRGREIFPLAVTFLYLLLTHSVAEFAVSHSLKEVEDDPLWSTLWMFGLVVHVFVDTRTWEARMRSCSFLEEEEEGIV